jgi:hypothetical protein
VVSDLEPGKLAQAQRRRIDAEERDPGGAATEDDLQRITRPHPRTGEHAAGVRIHLDQSGIRARPDRRLAHRELGRDAACESRRRPSKEGAPGSLAALARTTDTYGGASCRNHTPFLRILVRHESQIVPPDQPEARSDCVGTRLTASHGFGGHSRTLAQPMSRKPNQVNYSTRA